MTEMILAFIAAHISAVVPLVAGLAVQEVIRFLPVKPNSFLEAFGVILVKVGTAIVGRAAKVDAPTQWINPVSPVDPQ